MADHRIRKGHSVKLVPGTLTPVWSSANDRVAKVSSTGHVTGVGPGTTEVYCSVGGVAVKTWTVAVEAPSK
jgi:hypothetical protein